MNTELFRLNRSMERDPAITAWFEKHRGEPGDLAREWFEVMRGCGDEVREVLHDGCPVVCLGDVPFAYVNVFTAHANVGFFQGASLPDPSRLLQGTGRSMRHVKLKSAAASAKGALRLLIESAYAEIKTRVENG